jgi:endonuclease/exonuclease/phosphatase family metal-dependent hydrolase
MRKLLTLVLLATTCIPLAASQANPAGDDGIPQISWKDADDYYGRTCAVYGTVILTKDIGNRTFLNFDRDFRKTFTAVVQSEDYGKFPEPPHRAYLNQHVRVVGEIVKHQGKPEIIIKSPDAITIVSDPTPPRKAAKAETTEDDQRSDADGGEPNATTPPPAAKWIMPADGAIRIATYNVLNLFDNLDDPYVKNENLPGKPADELEHLAAGIRKLNADILALQEVENRPFLREFVSTHLSDMGYREVVLFEGNNERGIDVALLSRLPVGPVMSYRHLEFPDANGHPMRFQRDLLRVRFEPEKHVAFEVFVVHLKSKHGSAEASLPLRMGEATTIRGLFNDILRHNPSAPFVICGDFNDTIESEPVRRILGEGPTALRSFIDGLPPDKRITYTRTHLSMIDFILASPAMATMYVEGSYAVAPGSIPTTGSDHNPVVATFRLPESRTEN